MTLGKPLFAILTVTLASTSALVLSTCGSDDEPVIDAAPNPDAPLDDAGNPVICDPQSGTNLALEEVAAGLSSPVFLTAPKNDPRLFILEQRGRIRLVKDGLLVGTPFLDIDSLVRSQGDEQGLLGLAFHPDYAQNGRFYVHYTAEDPVGASVVAAYTVSDDPDVANTSGQRLLTVTQPFGNHNGGMLAFGPDGYLYISLGDGGFRDDPDGNGQNPDTLLGSILRIDVDNGSPYSSPASNPFVGGAGADEVWSYGLRNPWRFSFDRDTGDVYIGDVGQGCWEEINVQPANSTGGENFGWNIVEGAHCFDDLLDDDGCPERGACSMASFEAPVHEYAHTGGRCSITGGYVYRGQCLPDIQGWYFFGDYCSNEVFKLEYQGGSATAVEEVTDNLDQGGVIDELTSFGEDGYGELYVLSRAGTVHRIVAGN